MCSVWFQVYEHLTYDDHVHHRIASLPGMWDRTITIGSAGKTFGATGKFFLKILKFKTEVFIIVNIHYYYNHLLNTSDTSKDDNSYGYK